MRSTIIILLLLVLSTAVFAQTSLKTGNAAPVFAAPSLDGNFYDLAAMHGKVVIVTFWSTKCEICRNEIPKLNSLMTKYDERKVVFLALSMDNEAILTGYLRSN